MSYHGKCAKLKSHRAHSRQCHEHLRTVRQYHLEYAGEGVEYRCRLARRYTVLLSHLGGYRVCHNDGNRIVGGRDVHKGNQKTDTELSAYLTSEHSADSVKQTLEAASRMRAHKAATSTATIAVSYIPATPLPTPSSRDGKVSAPVVSITIQPAAMPIISVTKTFIPIIPPISTRI